MSTENMSAMLKLAKINADLTDKHYEDVIELSKKNIEISNYKTEIKKKELLIKERNDIILQLRAVCEKHDIDNPLISIASSCCRPTTSTLPIEIDAHESEYNSVVVDGINYPPKMYHEIPGNPYGSICECKCRQIARYICRAEQHSAGFMNPLNRVSLSLIDTVKKYNNIGSSNLSDCIRENMTREKALHYFKMCKACTCCNRHNKKFPISISDISN
jgi:hypothetical protein